METPDYNNLKEIIVKSQSELDMIPLDCKGRIYIEFGTDLAPAVVRNKYYLSVVAREHSNVVAREHSNVVAWGHSNVVAMGHSNVEAREYSNVVAWEHSNVEAMGHSYVEAR